jgi:hypothetical protein
MLRIQAATPLEGRRLRLTLNDGTIVERDITELIAWGPVFERLKTDDDYFRKVRIRYGTVVWPGDVDIAPETMIWGDEDPFKKDQHRPIPFMRIHWPPSEPSDP